MSKAFEIARLLVLQAASDDRIDRPRAYAWAKRIYPLNAGELERKFKDDFEISESRVAEVFSAIDRKIANGEKVSFYSLESEFAPLSGGGRFDRWDLIRICRLASVDHRFDESVIEQLVEKGSGPIESHGIDRPLGVDDLEP